MAGPLDAVVVRPRSFKHTTLSLEIVLLSSRIASPIWGSMKGEESLRSLMSSTSFCQLVRFSATMRGCQSSLKLEIPRYKKQDTNKLQIPSPKFPSGAQSREPRAAVASARRTQVPRRKRTQSFFRVRSGAAGGWAKGLRKNNLVELALRFAPDLAAND